MRQSCNDARSGTARRTTVSFAESSRVMANSVSAVVVKAMSDRVKQIYSEGKGLVVAASLCELSVVRLHRSATTTAVPRPPQCHDHRSATTTAVPVAANEGGAVIATSTVTATAGIVALGLVRKRAPADVVKRGAVRTNGCCRPL